MIDSHPAPTAFSASASLPLVPIRKRQRRSWLLLACALILGTSTLGNVNAGELLPPYIAAQFGIVESWRHQLDVGVGAKSIVDQKIYVSSTDKRTLVELVSTNPTSTDRAGRPTVYASFATDQKNSLGMAVGEQEATRLAKNEQRRLRRRGIETELQTISVNQVRMYVLTDRGSLEALDGESGELLWTAHFGKPTRQYGTIGCDDDYVVVTNGSEAFLISAENGRILRRHSLKFPPLHGPVLTAGMALIPGIGGTLEGLYLDDDEREPFSIRTSGAALAPAASAPGTGKIAWASDQGFTFVMNMSGTPSMQFRLNTSGDVNGRIASADGERFFFCTTHGQVYAVKATRHGEVLWNQPLGEPMFGGVFMAGEQLYVKSSLGNLFALEVTTGRQVWESPATGIDQVISAVGDYVVTRSMSGMLTVLDAKTGQRKATLNGVFPMVTFPNAVTDRVYLVSSGGTLQCLRPENAVLPTFRSTPSAPAITELAGAEDSSGESVSATMAAEEENPFGTSEVSPFDAMGDDPFETGEGDDNPFGAMEGEDPFADLGEDPF